MPVLRPLRPSATLALGPLFVAVAAGVRRLMLAHPAVAFPLLTAMAKGAPPRRYVTSLTSRRDAKRIRTARFGVASSKLPSEATWFAPDLAHGPLLLRLVVRGLLKVVEKGAAGGKGIAAFHRGLTAINC